MSGALIRLPSCTRCDSEAFDQAVIAMTAKGQRLGRGCGPLVVVRTSGDGSAAKHVCILLAKRERDEPRPRLGPTAFAAVCVPVPASRTRLWFERSGSGTSARPGQESL